MTTRLQLIVKTETDLFNWILECPSNFQLSPAVVFNSQSQSATLPHFYYSDRRERNGIKISFIATFEGDADSIMKSDPQLH